MITVETATADDLDWIPPRDFDGIKQIALKIPDAEVANSRFPRWFAKYELAAKRYSTNTPQRESEIETLRHELAAVRKELSALRREHNALWIRTHGGSVKEARETGHFRFKAGAPDTGKVHGLSDSLDTTFALVESIHDFLFAPLDERVEDQPAGLFKQILDLEQRVGDGLRHKGPYRESEQYIPGDVVTNQGCQWLAKRKTQQRPELAKEAKRDESDWWLIVKRGRDGRDLKDLTR